jgi:Kef-type K+ transport system membrane component KefB
MAAVSRRGEGTSRGADVSVVERSIGAVCGGFGLALFFLALGVGLRSSPPEVASQPVVIAATVIARAAIACGMLAFGFGLLRIAERLLAGRGSTLNRLAEPTAARDPRTPGLGPP